MTNNNYCIKYNKNTHTDKNFYDDDNSRVITKTDNENTDCSYYNSLANNNEIISNLKCCDKNLLSGKFNTIDNDSIKYYIDSTTDSYKTCGHESEEVCHDSWPTKSWNDKENYTENDWKKYDDYIKCIFDNNSEVKDYYQDKNYGYMTLNKNANIETIHSSFSEDGHPLNNHPPLPNCPAKLETGNLTNNISILKKQNDILINESYTKNYNDINYLNQRINLISNNINEEHNKDYDKKSIILLLSIISIIFIIYVSIMLYKNNKNIIKKILTPPSKNLNKSSLNLNKSSLNLNRSLLNLNK